MICADHVKFMKNDKGIGGCGPKTWRENICVERRKIL